MIKLRIVVFALIVALLAGCSAKISAPKQPQNGSLVNAPYDIVIEDGEYYLVLTNEIAGENTSGPNTSEKKPAIEFASINEMVQDINTGKFTDDEMRQLSKFKTDDNGRIIICNLSNLYDARTPEQYETKRIVWYGDEYVFHFFNGTDFCCQISQVGTRANLEQMITRAKNKTEEDFYIELSTQQIEERNATVITYTTATADDHQRFKNVYYTIAAGNKELFVFEEYGADSDSKPHSIYLYGTEDGINYTVALEQLQERPSVEWLSQFGLRKYVETEVA